MSGKITKQELDTGLRTEIEDKVGSAHLNTELNKKANFTHTHSIANVTGLQTAINGKANSTHTHNMEDIHGLEGALRGKEPFLAEIQKRRIYVIGLNDPLPPNALDGDICLRLEV